MRGTAMEPSPGNVYEYRNAPLKDPKARERVVWVIFGGGGLLMMAIAALVALTTEVGVARGLKSGAVYLGLGLLIAILPFGLRHGIRSQNARREAFWIEITRTGLLRVSSLINVGGLADKPLLEPNTNEVVLREVTDVTFGQSSEGGGADNGLRTVSHFIRLSRPGGGDDVIALPPDALGQPSTLTAAEQERFLAAARPFLASP